MLDLVGDVFTYLTVIGKTSLRKGGGVVWQCRCVCGKEHLVSSQHLRKGDIKSCGCMRVELLRNTSTKHGRYNTPTYSSWKSMRARCLYQNNPEYFRYGGSGITICDRWMESFDNFLEDMGERPEGMSIDRVDPQGNYEPNNCRWATANEQSYNQGLSKRNTSGVAGVFWEEKCKKWRVRIQKDNVLLANTYFEDYDIAVEYRLKLEETYYGRKKQNSVVE